MVQIASGAFSSDRGGAGLDKAPMWDDPTVWTEDFNAKVAGFPQIAHWYQNWHTKGAWDVDKIYTLTGRGELPMISWAPRNPNVGTSDTTYNLDSINSGTHDAYMTEWAREAAAYGAPMLFRPMWEMNGSFYSWGVGVQGQTAADYVAAFRRMVDIFRSNGAMNVKWIWCPLANGNFPVTDMYPGDTYVDYTGLDGYNYMASTTFQTVAQVFDSAYNAIATLAPAKPFIICEVGSMEENGDKAAWITDLFNRAHSNYTNTKAIIWFDANNSDVGEKDWRINTSPASLSAFDASILEAENSGAIESGVQFITNTEITGVGVTNVNISVPVADLATDDIMILDVGGGSFSDFILDDPGWEKFAENTDSGVLTSGNMRHNLYWKRASGGQRELINIATTNTGITRNFVISLSVYRGCKVTESPISVVGTNYFDGIISAGSTMVLPTVTPLGDRQRVIGSLYIRDAAAGSDLAITNWPHHYDEHYEVTTLTTDTNSQSLSAADTHIPEAGTEVTPRPVITNSQVRFVAMTFALVPEPVVPMAPTKTQKIPPTNTTEVVNLTPTDDASATAIIDDDPYASDGQFLTAADPGGGGSVSAYAESHTTHPFGVSGGFTDPQNAYGSTAGNFATSTMPTRNAWYGNLMTLATAMAAIPNDAVISNFLCRVRWQASSTGVNGIMSVYSGGTLLGETTSAAVSTTLSTGTYSSLPAQPTVAQLKSPTFGIGIRVQRTVSQGRTFSLDWIQVEFTYTAPGSTIPITVQVEMGLPTDPLALTSTTNGTANVLVRKKGGGSNPTLTIELREAGVLLQTLASGKAVTDAIGQVIVAPMDQHLITDPANVQLRLTSPGASGGVVEVGAVEWAAQILPPAIGVSWDASLEPDFNYYNLYRSTVTGGPYTRVNTDPIVQPEYTDTEVSTGNDYYYVVTAVDTSGNESAYSAEQLAVQGTTTISLVRTAETIMRPIQNAGMRAALAKVRAGLTSVGSIVHLSNRIKGRMVTALTHVAPLFESASRSITVGRNAVTYLASTQNVLNRITCAVRAGTSQVGAITQAAQRIKGRVVSALTSVAPLASAASRTKAVARLVTTQVGNVQNLGSRLLQSLRTGTSYVDDALQSASRVKARVLTALSYISSLGSTASRTTRLYRIGSSFVGAVQHVPSRIRASLRTGSTYIAPLAQIANITKERLLTALTYVGSIPQSNARVKAMLRNGISYIGAVVQLVARTTQLYRLTQTYVTGVAQLANRTRTALRTGLSYIATNTHTGSVLSSLYRQVGTSVQSVSQGAQRTLSALRAAISYVSPIAHLSSRFLPVLRSAVTYVEGSSHTGARIVAAARTSTLYVGSILQSASRQFAKTRAALTYVLGSAQSSSRLKELARSALTYLNIGELSNRTTVLYRAVSSYVGPVVQLVTSSLVINLVRTALTTIGNIRQATSTLRQAFRTLVSYVSPLNHTTSRLADKVRVASNTYVAPIVQQGNRYFQAFKTALTWMTSGQAVSRIIGRGRAALTYIGETYHAAQRRSQLFRLITTSVGAIAQRSTVGIAQFIVRNANTFVSAFSSAASMTARLYRTGLSFVQNVQNSSSRLLATFRNIVTSMAPIVHIGSRVVTRLRNSTTYLVLGSAASRILGIVRSGASYVQTYHTSSRRSALYRDVTSGVASIVQLATRSLALNLVRTALTVFGVLNSTATTTRQAYRTLISYVRPLQSATTRFLGSFRSVASAVGALGNVGNRFLGFARSSVSYVAGLAHVPSRIASKVRRGVSYLQALHETSSRRSALYRDISTGVGVIWQTVSAIPAVVMLRSAVTYVLTNHVANRAVAFRRTVSTAIDFIRHLVSRITNLFRSPDTDSGEFQNQSTSSTSRPRTAGTYVVVVEQTSSGEINLYVPPQTIPIVLVQTMKKPVAIERRKGHVTVESVKKPVEITVSEGNIS